MSKPRNEDGLWCPLWKRPTSKVCDTCSLYTKIIRRGPNGTEEVWLCGFNASLEFQSRSLTKLDEVSKSNDGARNAFLDFKQSMLKLISMLYQLRPHSRTPMQLEDKSDGKD